MGSAGKQRQDKKALAKTKESITPTPYKQQTQDFSEKTDSVREEITGGSLFLTEIRKTI